MSPTPTLVSPLSPFSSPALLNSLSSPLLSRYCAVCAFEGSLVTVGIRLLGRLQRPISTTTCSGSTLLHASRCYLSVVFPCALSLVLLLSLSIFVGKMNSLKNYLKPGKAKQAAAAPPQEMTLVQQGVSRSSIAPSTLGTPRTSRPASLYPAGDFRNSALEEIIDIKCDVMVNWLHQQQLESMWSSGGPGEGVVLKKTRDNFTCCPSELAECRGDFFDAIRALNVRVSGRKILVPGLC